MITDENQDLVPQFEKRVLEEEEEEDTGKKLRRNATKDEQDWENGTRFNDQTYNSSVAYLKAAVLQAQKMNTSTEGKVKFLENAHANAKKNWLEIQAMQKELQNLGEQMTPPRTPINYIPIIKELSDNFNYEASIIKY